MQFHWVRDRLKKTFRRIWKPGVSKLGDYFTKHTLSEYDKGMRTVYLHFPNRG